MIRTLRNRTGVRFMIGAGGRGPGAGVRNQGMCQELEISRKEDRIKAASYWSLVSAPRPLAPGPRPLPVHRCRNDERDADDDRADDDAERDVLIVFKFFAHGKRRDFDD